MDIKILSHEEQTGGLVVTFAVELPFFLTPLSPPSVLPLQTLVNITNSLSSNIQGTTKKTTIMCNITTNESVAVSPSPSATLDTILSVDTVPSVTPTDGSVPEVSEDQERRNSVIVTIGLTTLEQVGITDYMYVCTMEFYNWFNKSKYNRKITINQRFFGRNWTVV